MKMAHVTAPYCIALGVLLSVAPAHADVLGAPNACQAERQRIADLPATLMRNGWSGVTLPIRNGGVNPALRR